MPVDQASYARILAGSGIRGGLRQALQAWDGLIELLPIAIYVCDADGTIVQYNHRAVDLWGRAPSVGVSEARFCGSHRLFFHGRQIRHEETPMAEVLRSGEPVRGAEGMLERPDGSRVWVTVYIEPIRDEAGRLIGAINCFHETTAQKQAEARVREQDRRLAATYERATIGIVEVDAEGRRLWINDAGLAMTGVRREELIGHSIFPETDREYFSDDWEQFQRLISGEIDRYSTERMYTDKSGAAIWISVMCSAVRDDEGRFLYAVRVFDDITKSKQIADALAESQSRLAATYEQATIGISEADADGKLLRVNEASCKLTGFSREELLNRGSFFNSMRPEDVDAERDLYRKQVKGEIDRYTIDKRIRRKDGTEIYVSVMSSSVRDRNGKFRYAVRVIQDVTERKRAEARQQTLIDELNHRVKNTLATVQSLARQSAAGAASVSEFQERFQGRLIALSEGHDQLTRESWEQAGLEDILRAALLPYSDALAPRIAIEGDDVELRPRAALTLTMVFHELITNAVKYGALSGSNGALRVAWSVDRANGQPEVSVLWQESDGPPVEPPKRKGFGTKMVERSVVAELGGSASLQFDSAGLRCALRFPLAESLDRRSNES